MKFKKLLAVMLAAVTFALTAAVTVSADSIFDTAKNVGSGKKVTKTIDRNNPMGCKITPTQKGTATVKVTANTESFDFYVYDEDGNDIAYKAKVNMGSTDNKTFFMWNGNAKTFKGTFSFDVKANKTYYVQIVQDFRLSNSSKVEASFKYPTGEAEETALMGVTLKKGETIQLYANDSSAKWSTSNKAAATVSSSGLVKAVKKGKAVITLKCGSKSQKIEIVVT